MEELPAERSACGVYATPESPVSVVDYPAEPVVLEHTTHIWGGKESDSLIYLPSDDGRNTAPGRFPLAILLHGKTYDYTEYTTLQRRLAQNGIASVSIQYSKHHADSDYSPESFYEVFDKNLFGIYNYTGQDINPLYGKVSRNIAILGHSMGGGLGVLAANRVVKDGVHDVDVRSVIAMAPNPHAEFEWHVEPDVAQGLLVLLGSNDADSGVNTPGNSGFYTYDTSGYLQNEYSNGYHKHAFTKSMIYMKGADHLAFVDDGDPSAREAAVAYIVAYARWSLMSDQAYGVYFRRQAPVGNAVPVSVLHSEPYRRVMDNFEGASAGFNDLGGKNTFLHLLVEHDASVFEDESPHYTYVLRLRWDSGKGLPVARFGLPLPMKGHLDMRDLSAFSHMSFRAGQMYHSGKNNEALDFRIRFDYHQNGQHLSQTRKLSDFGSIPSPFAHNQASGTKSVMNTVLVPLCMFEQIDFDKALITGISFEFSVPGSETGEIQMDSLEFIY